MKKYFFCCFGFTKKICICACTPLGQKKTKEELFLLLRVLNGPPLCATLA